MKTGVFFKPMFDVGMRMRAVVVQDQMKIQPAWRLAVEVAHKLQEFLVPMTRITGADNRPLQHVERCKQRCRPVTLVVTGHRSTATFFHRQPRLGPVQGLNLRLLINAQNQRFLGGIQIKPDDVGQLFHEPLIFRHLERLDPVRLKSMRLPDPSDGHVAHADLFGQRSCAPMRGIRWKRMQSPLDDEIHRLFLRAPRTRSMRCVFPDSRRPLLLKTVSPKNDGRSGCAQAFGDRIVRDALGGQKTDARPQHDPLGRSPCLNPGLQGPSLFRCHRQTFGWIPHT